MDMAVVPAAIAPPISARIVAELFKSHTSYTPDPPRGIGSVRRPDFLSQSALYRDFPVAGTNQSIGASPGRGKTFAQTALELSPVLQEQLLSTLELKGGNQAF